MTDYASIFFTMIIIDNFIFSKQLGVCPTFRCAENTENAIHLSVAVTFVMVIASAITWPIHFFLVTRPGDALDLSYLETLIFVLVIVLTVQWLHCLCKEFLPKIHALFGIYLPQLSTNCAILGISLMNVENGYTFTESIISGFGAGIGYLYAMVLFSSIEKKLLNANPPACFQGIPITMISASIVAMSFMGFGGILD